MAIILVFGAQTALWNPSAVLNTRGVGINLVFFSTEIAVGLYNGNGIQYMSVIIMNH